MAPKEVDIEVLLEAIKDTQETIRAFDLKAEILTAIMTLLLAIVAFAWHDHDTATLKLLDTIVITTAFGAMGCLMGVLFPKSNPADAVKLGTYNPAGIYYIGEKQLGNDTVSGLAQALKNVNWQEELVYELMKVSSIRERKHDWFMRALSAATMSFVFLFILCLIRYI